MEFQEKKQAMLSFVTFFSLLLLGHLFAEIDEKLHYETDPISIVEDHEVHVGVILDMGSREGKIILSCISMALSDFYHLHSNYSTRIVLHTRDSNGKPLHALLAALNLLDNIKVEAIIGAQTSMEANLLADLGEAAKVPVMSLSEPPSPPLIDKYSFLVEITQGETSQVMGISALIEVLKWKDVILLYENTEYGKDIIPSLVNSFQEKNVHIAYKSSIAASSTNEQIVEELQKLKTLKTSAFVVHMSHLLVPRLFVNAKKLGMMSEGYAWIVTSTSMNFLHSMDPSVIESMQGVLGLKSYIPTSRSLHNLTSRLRRKFYIKEANMEVRELSADGIWAYDATWALAEAVERARNIINSTSREPDIRLNLTDLRSIIPCLEDLKSFRYLNDFRSSKHGVVLLREIVQSRFKGLSGEIQYLNGKLISQAFEIVNVIGKGDRRVAFWPCKEEKATKESHRSPLLNIRRNVLSTNDLETIIWPGGSKTIMKGSRRQLSSEIKLRIGVPVKVGFEELVRVEHDLQTNITHVTGYCIDVFEAAIRALPYKVQYEFFPFEDANGVMAGAYNDLVYQVYLQNYDAVVGDTTITSNRSQYVDFTIPYTDMGVGMLVPNEKENMWIFLRPLSSNLWITSAGFFILTGFVVWVIERPANEEFQGTPAQQIGTILWFSFSTLVYAHREKLSNNLAKFVVIIWVFVVLILTSSYTATLASMMTVKQIQLNSRGNFIGYQSGSLGVIVNFNFKGIKPYRSVEEYADALSKGSKHGGVSAIIDEVPYINIFLAKYPADYSMIKTMSITNGFAFVFPKGSKLARDVSRQIEHMREEGKLLEMEKTWYLRKTNLMSEDVTMSTPNTLRLYDFRGLFLVSGVSLALALFLFIIFSSTFRNVIGAQLKRLRMFLFNMVSNGTQ